MTTATPHSPTHILDSYLHALQDLHREHQRDYEQREAHPEIHKAVDHVDTHLECLHATPVSSELTSSTATANDLRVQVRSVCAHKSLRRHLQESVEMDESRVNQLFHKYRLDHDWLARLGEVVDERVQQLLAYLHELLSTLDLSYQLRSLATIYAR